MSKTSPASVFSSSFDKWSKDLWSMVHFLKTENEEFQEDYLEVSLALRRQFLRAKITRSGWDQSRFVKKFLELWRARIRSLSKRQGLGLGTGPEEMEFIDQIILFVVSKQGGKIQDLAKWLGIPFETVKKRAFEAMLDFQKVDFNQRKYLDRDCVRNDLYRLNKIYNYEWKDPLKLYTKESHKLHAEKCPRCQKVNSAIQESILKLESIQIRKMPQVFSELLDSEMKSSFKVVSLDSLALWPWYLKTPIQMALVGLVLFSLINLPYLGDMYPGFEKTQKKASEVANSTLQKFEGLWEKGISAFDSARTAVYEKWIAARQVEKIPVESPPTDVEKVASVEPPPLVTPEPMVLESPPTPVPPVTKPVIVAQPQKAPVKVTPQPTDEEVQSAKIFFRWGAFSRDLPLQTSQMLELLQKYGAFKAGDLELGAGYKGGSYFHFTVKEENLQQLIADIKKIGLVDFTQSSAKSDRLTDKGYKRVVFLLAPSR
jgi:hypothetical protein